MEGAIGTTEMAPASQAAGAGAGNPGIQRAMAAWPLPWNVLVSVSPLSLERAQMVAVLEWLPVPEAVAMPAAFAKPLLSLLMWGLPSLCGARLCLR